MKKILYLFLITLIVICTSGCSKEFKINSDSKLAEAKRIMNNNLNNYSYDVKMITKAGFMNVTTNMRCKDDRKNKINYCITSTYGVNNEEYIDYQNKIVYSKASVTLVEDATSGRWTSSKYTGGDSNTWINLNDYIFNLTEEKKDGGTYYKGTINSQKLVEAIAQIDTDIDISNIVSDDIDISVFINLSNYIESMSFTIEIMGIEELVEINYRDFNTSGDIVIPSEVKEN